MAVYVFGAAEPVSLFSPVFADNTWEEIIRACELNRVPDTWNVGDSKVMTINDVDYQIDIIGKNHDIYSDGTGTAPLTFQMNGIYDDMYKINDTISNRVGWKGCTVRVTHIPAILVLMPEEVQRGLREVNKLTTAGGQDNTIVTTADKLFLLSEVETFGTIVETSAGEGVQYKYYAMGNSTAKKRLNQDQRWWLRSPLRTNSYDFCCVNSGGALTHYNANDTHGLSLAFCF